MRRKVTPKTGYFRTSKSKEKVPDSMLRCQFCGGVNSDLNMIVVISGETSAGNGMRQAHHSACAALYKKHRRVKTAAKPVDEAITLDFGEPREDDLLMRLINNTETATSGNPKER